MVSRKTAFDGLIHMNFKLKAFHQDSLGEGEQLANNNNNNNNNMNTTGITFLSDLGRRLTSVIGDSRETTYLFQRVSLAVQRYNSVAFKGTFLVPTELD